MAINNRSSLLTDPIRNFRFLVQFKPHSQSAGLAFKPTLGFTSISGLAVQTESIPYREGGYNTTIHQIPGQTTFQPLMFQRGVMVNTPQNWRWMRRLFAVTAESGVQGGNYSFRADLDIYVLGHPHPITAASEIGNNTYQGGASTLTGDNIGDAAILSGEAVRMKFSVYNAWPTSVAYSDLSAGDNALLVEQMTLVHEGFTVEWYKESEGKNDPTTGLSMDPGTGTDGPF